MELDARGQNSIASRLMPSLYAISCAAKMIGEHREFVDVISANSDNIDEGEMFIIWTSQEHGIVGLTDQVIACLRGRSETG
jgi:hypothetical protein